MPRRDGTLLPDGKDKKRKDRRDVFDREKIEAPKKSQKRKNLNTGTGPMQRGPGRRGKPTPSVRERRNDNLDFSGPAALSGIAGLRRAAASGMLGRMRNSDLRDMRIRETDAYRRLKVNQGGRALSREIAINRQIAKTGVGQGTGYGQEIKRADLRRVRSWTPETFPQGEPSGRRPVPFRSPGNLAEANAAGKGAIKKGVPRTTPPAGRPSGSGTGRGGTRVDGVGRGGGIRIGLRRGIGER